MSGLRITLAVAYVCLFVFAFFIGLAALNSPGGSTGFAWVALMTMPWSLLAMFLLDYPSSATKVLAAVWVLVVSPLINVSLLLGLHHRWRPWRSNSEVQSTGTELARPRSLWRLLLGSIPLSMLIAFPVAAVYGYFFPLPHPERPEKFGLEASFAFVRIKVLSSYGPLLIVYGMGFVAAAVAFCTRVRVHESRILVWIMLTASWQFIALVIWRAS